MEHYSAEDVERRHQELHSVLIRIAEALEQLVPKEAMLDTTEDDDTSLYISVMAHGTTPEETAQLLTNAFDKRLKNGVS